ncbi:hypothetical protein [Lysobacter auxotrophicus]|uniref:PASTA domain-containing protein n=1 Tax=Lysobacter auxotrophicus TaxID=2992573 RepID=A0ABN6UKM3_9GAMM|nr:hypothetical protein [Lysobacter auxotrophicus]BDU16816.1 hypothetical protein LA521A_20170 [Lysobacter auxotrophicus]
MDSPSFKHGVFRCIALAALACCAPALAAPPASVLGAEWVAIDPALLDDMRGGFLTSGGTALSFGIERAVFVNGELLATTRVQIPDVARMTADQAQELQRFNQGVVVQIGGGNTFEPSGAPGGIVIQNTRDGQDIRALTTVNVGVDTLQAFQDLNTQSTLHNAMVTATAP